jgi:hypothetical protein
LNFLYRSSKNIQISYFIKICPVGAKLFHADKQTDMMKLTAAVYTCANMPKNSTCCQVIPISQGYILQPQTEKVPGLTNRQI